MNKHFTKDIVYVGKKDSIFFQEGKVVGYISHKGNTTYRILINETEIIDAEEDEILSEIDVFKIKRNAKIA